MSLFKSGKPTAKPDQPSSKKASDNTQNAKGDELKGMPNTIVGSLEYYKLSSSKRIDYLLL